MEVPLLVVEGANTSLFEPSGDAVEVEGVIASTPGSSALVTGVSDLVSLAVDTSLHDVVLANGTIVNVNV